MVSYNKNAFFNFVLFVNGVSIGVLRFFCRACILKSNFNAHVSIDTPILDYFFTN